MIIRKSGSLVDHGKHIVTFQLIIETPNRDCDLLIEKLHPIPGRGPWLAVRTIWLARWYGWLNAMAGWMPWARQSTYTTEGVNLNHSFSRFWINRDSRNNVQVGVLGQLSRNECVNTEELSKWHSVSSPSASMVDENLFKLISRIKIKIPA